MDILLILLSFLCLICGFLGCIVPMLPGPPIAYVGLLLLHATDKVQFSATQLWLWLGFVIITLVLDYIVPMLGAKYCHGTKWGSWGALIGSILGMFFLPIGLLLGPFLGAVIGELMGNQSPDQALKSGLGSLIGFILGTVIKLAFCGYFIIEFFRALF